MWKFGIRSRLNWDNSCAGVWMEERTYGSRKRVVNTATLIRQEEAKRVCHRKVRKGKGRSTGKARDWSAPLHGSKVKWVWSGSFRQVWVLSDSLVSWTVWYVWPEIKLGFLGWINFWYPWSRQLSHSLVLESRAKNLDLVLLVPLLQDGRFASKICHFLTKMYAAALWHAGVWLLALSD